MSITGKASLICTTPSGGDWDGFMSITVRDEKSRAEFLELKVPYAEMLQALTARQVHDVQFILRPAIVGCDREIKTEVVQIPDRLAHDDEESLSKALSPYEIDGWRATRSDARNIHRWAGQPENGMRPFSIGFVRYIHPDGTPADRGPSERAAK